MAEARLSYDQWKAKYAPHDSGADYDLKGAFEAGLVPSENQHFPDTFKMPNHPTFSIESKYWKPGLAAGRWEGEKYIPMTAQQAAEWVKARGQNLAPQRNPMQFDPEFIEKLRVLGQMGGNR